MKILVVDDEPEVLANTARQLAELGYTVLEADGGREALKLLQSHSDIALLFTDIVMPGNIDGFDLAESAKKLRPNIKVLYMSGYLRDEGVWYGGLLPKPWEPPDLHRAVKDALT